MELFDVTDAIASYDWDLTTVAELHRSLSDEMKKELLRWRVGGVQVSRKVTDQITRVILGPTNKARFPAPQNR